MLADPRSRLIIQDARAHLSLSPKRYDVIVSEPSNPWMAGCAALFTRDFFAQVRARLTEQGCFALWLHAYQIDWPSVELIGRTFVDVFPAHALVATHPALVGSDYLLLGFKAANPLAAADSFAFTNAAATRQSANVILPDPRLLHRLIVSDDCRETFGPGPLNTDDRPLLEFQAPRQMHRGRGSASAVIEQLLRHRSLPPSTRAYFSSKLCGLILPCPWPARESASCKAVHNARQKETGSGNAMTDRNRSDHSRSRPHAFSSRALASLRFAPSGRSRRPGSS